MPKIIGNYEFPDDATGQEILEYIALNSKSTSKPNFQAAKEVIDRPQNVNSDINVINHIRNMFSDKSSLGTALGGLVKNPIGAFAGSIAGQAMDTADNGGIMDPISMTKNAVVDTGINFGLDKIFKGLGNRVGVALDRAPQTALDKDYNYKPSLKDAFLRMKEPEFQPTADPLDLHALRKDFTGTVVPQTRQQLDDIAIAQRQKQVEPLAEHTKILGMKTTKQGQEFISQQEQLTKSEFFKPVFKDRKSAADFMLTASNELKQTGRTAYFEKLMGSSETLGSKTFKPAKIVEQLEDLNGPAAEFFDAKQRARLIRFAKKAEAKLGQDLGTNKAAAIVDETGNVIMRLAMDASVGNYMPNRLKRYAAGALVRFPLKAAEKLLSTPKLTENVTRMMDIKPDSPEAKFAAKFVFGALKGKQIQLQLPNSDTWFNGSVDEQGKIQLDSSK
jgi:hypothetical protein